VAEATVAYSQSVQGGFWSGGANVLVENDSNHIGRVGVIIASMRASATFSMSGSVGTWDEVADGGTSDSIAVYVKTLDVDDINDTITITPSTTGNGALGLFILDGLGTYNAVAAALANFTGDTTPTTGSAAAPPSGGTTLIAIGAESATTPAAPSKSGWSADNTDRGGDDFYTSGLLWLTDGASGSGINYSLGGSAVGDGAHVVLSFNPPAGAAGGSESGGAETDTGYGFGGTCHPEAAVVDDTYRGWLSHGEMFTVCRLYDGSNGALLYSNWSADLASSDVGLIEVELSDVSVDRERAVRATSGLTISDPVGLGIVPTDAHSVLGTLSGVDVHVLTGMTDGTTTRLYPLGMFVIAEAEVDAGADGVTYTAKLEDRAWRLNRRMGAAVTFNADTNVVTAIESLVLGALPDMTFHSDSSPFSIPVMYLEPDDNRLDICRRLAEAAGMEIFFESCGHCVIRNLETNTSGDPRFEYGLGGLAASGLKRKFENHTSLMNGVIVEGADLAEGLPATGTYFDRDTSSPGYYDPAGANTQTSLMGPSPEVIQLDFVSTDAQAIVAAFGRLVMFGNGPERIKMQCGPNPALGVGDLVKVTHTDAKISGNWEVMSVSHPTSPGLASVELRQEWDPTGGTSINE